ncbi:hypothetical protein RGL50_004015 [Vibrio alginolyticus]|nr:hypothetical protein [Vibrio alginolyticus]
MYDFYNGDDDPKLYESDCVTAEDIENFGAVQCSSCCEYWRGGQLYKDQCPECGDNCYPCEPD